MNIRTIGAGVLFGCISLFVTGCGNTEEKVTAADVEQLKQYTEQRFNDLQAHLTVISEQMDRQPSTVTLQPEAVTVTPVNPATTDAAIVQITDITPATAPSRTLKDEIASLSQPVPSVSRSRPAKIRSVTAKKRKSNSRKKVILIPALGVRDVQQALKNAGFNPGKVDGRMGPNTQRAIKQFQSAEGLKSDGIVGRQTWNKLSTHLSGAAF